MTPSACSRPWVRAWWRALAGADAGGVATYSSAGALFGYGQLWTVPVMCLLLIVAQETAARMGCVTGKGFASLIREQFGVRMSTLAMLALLISNTTVTLSEFAGIASGFALFGIPAYVSVPIAAVAIWALTMSGSYHRIEKILLLISCAFVTYVVAGVMVGPDWGDALNATLIPRFSTDPQYFSVLVANIGTTIAPWMIFLAQSNVVEKNAHAEDLPYQRIDTVTGSVVASAISWFIILTTGAVLFPAGIAVNGAEDAAKRPGPARRALRRGALWRRSGGRELPCRLRASRHHLQRHLRGIWLGARRRPQLAGGPGLPRHHHCHHVPFGRHRDHPQR